MTEQADSFSLERFEYLAYTRSHEEAARELFKLLHSLDSKYGGLDMEAKLYATNAPTQIPHLLTRLASALSCLFSDPNFHLSLEGFGQLISWQRWLSSIFAASPFVNADHILRAMNSRDDGDRIELSGDDMVKFCMLFTPESEIPLDLEQIWNFSHKLAAALFFVLLSPRFLGTTAAHGKRELLLQWLPSRLEELDNLDLMPVGILHDVYMHCSYADYPGKHDIKRPMNRLLRKAMANADLTDLDLSDRTVPQGKKRQKPVMLVVLEYLSVNHSIYRTHSSTLRAARDKFHLIGMGLPEFVDSQGQEVFHEFVELKQSAEGLFGMLRQIRALADERHVDVLYMPSVGMFQLTMFLANLRIAPLQLMALGHPATTHSPHIDYVVVEEDYVGDPDCFSEKLLILPEDGLPYVPSGAAPKKITPIFRENPEVVKIAICATTMKLNPHFLWACAAIVRQAKRRVEFHFLVGFSQGLVGIQVEQILKQYLGDYAVVYPHQPYQSYMEVLRDCDLFINPFPFGNTNGIVDTVTAGLVGVCRTGREVHEHIDQGLFARLGLPEWLVTHTTDEYVKATVRLVDNGAERVALRRALMAEDGVQRLFTGRPEIFGEKILQLHKELVQSHGRDSKADKTESARDLRKTNV